MALKRFRRTAAPLILCCLPVFITSKTDAAELRVMTFNIKGDVLGINPERSWRLLDLSDPNVFQILPNRDVRAISVIADYAPDILSVQELKLEQRSDLLSAFPEYDFYGQGRRGGTDDDANGIYFRSDRFSLLDQGDFWLSETPQVPGTTFVGNGSDTGNPRMATWVKLHDQQVGQDYFVLSTHWSLDSRARRDSAALIQSMLPTLAGDLPILLLGDFNATQNSSAYRTLRGLTDPNAVLFADSFIDAGGSDGRTFHNWSGGVSGTRIDHIFHRSNIFTAESAEIIRTTFDGGFYPSDHYPVTVTFTVVPEPALLPACGLLLALLLNRRGRGASTLLPNKWGEHPACRQVGRASCLPTSGASILLADK